MYFHRKNDVRLSLVVDKKYLQGFLNCVCLLLTGKWATLFHSYHLALTVDKINHMYWWPVLCHLLASSLEMQWRTGHGFALSLLSANNQVEKKHMNKQMQYTTMSTDIDGYSILYASKEQEAIYTYLWLSNEKERLNDLWQGFISL